MNDLSYGSIGRDVKALQLALNLLPSDLPSLRVDGFFGPRTNNRVVEFQQRAGIDGGGTVGEECWEALEDLVEFLNQDIDKVGKGVEVARIAREEAIGSGSAVRARKAGGKDTARNLTFRAGHDRLLGYFRLSAPDPKRPGRTYYTEDAIEYLHKEGELSPCPHWCGIFALWAYKKAGIAVGEWMDGYGISMVKGFRTTRVPLIGDVGYQDNGFQHHVVIDNAYLQDGQYFVDTMEGNADADSVITRRTRVPVGQFAALYTTI